LRGGGTTLTSVELVLPSGGGMVMVPAVQPVVHVSQLQSHLQSGVVSQSIT
jgi:hypothetical protein